MSDKIVAGLVTFAAILPLCAVCVLGPAAIGSVIAGFGAWLGGFDFWAVMLVAVGGAAAIYRLLRQRRNRRERQ
jgi:membrane protein DedA with SNARE-associated domain